MNQNLKVILVAATIFLVSISVWMIILGKNDIKNTDIKLLEQQAKHVQSNLILPTEDLHHIEKDADEKGE